MGKAMVATELDGLKEILNHGVTGILVPPQNPEAMAEKIIYLLQSEHERKRLGTNALNESRRFTVDSHMKIREKVYEKAIKISRNSTKQRYAYD
jgi:glycosyltransferase involved in cell wall biosynthesis